MSPHLSPSRLSNASIIKTVSYKVKPNVSQLPKPVPNYEIPISSPLPLLQSCNGEHQLNQIHARMICTGLIHSPPAASKLIASFASCSHSGTTAVARSIADQINGLDTYTWNTVIKGYLEEKNPKESILVYVHVRRKSQSVDSYTLLFFTRACGLIEGSIEGKQIHGQIIKMGFLSEMIIVTSIVNMYGLFGDLESAQRVLDESPQRDLVMWNALVAMYAQRNYSQEALLVLRYMLNEKVRPNEVTTVSILSACSSLTALREGKQVHSYIVKNLLCLDVYVYNALIDMYSKCGRLIDAERLFRMMPVRNTISWTTMINGFSNNNNPDKALDLVKEMDCTNIQPDEVTVLGIISTCSKLGSSKLGEWIDLYLKKNGIKENNVSVSNALIDMHAKCGNLEKSCQLFDQLEVKTLVSWTTMIQGLAMHGHGIAALTRFGQMQREGFRPDGVLFYSILSACSHSGLVDEGRRCFQSMIEDCDIIPGLMHYGCMVDLLCRAGLVGDAFHFVQDMPITPDVMIWRILLAACRNEGNVSLANQIMNRVLKLEPNYSGNYVLLSNLYANMGEWDTAEDVRTEMRVQGVIKQDPACSLIEVN